MKHVLLVCIAVILATISATAQTAPTVNAPPTVQEEIRTMSGQLKEAYGGVSQELSVLKKEIGPDASLATPEQSAKQSDLVTCLSQIEGMLTTVNTANEELWPEIRTKAELVRTKAISLGGMAK